MAQRNQYWSCTKFADWIRGTSKPSAATSDGWHDWENVSKSTHRFRHWVAEEVLDAIQNFIWWPADQIYSLKYYVNNRFITRTHCLTAHPRDIKPGQWQDVGNRFLPCLFNELVDYVEVELAWWHLAWEGKEARKKYKAPWWNFGWFRLRLWRSKQAGLDNLEWQRALRWKETEVGEDSPNLGKLTPQAINAQEILDLYTWWTEVYPKRPDPYDASGWTEYCEKIRILNDGRIFGSKKTPELEEMASIALAKSTEIEQAYEKEDEDMMIRLIKVRNSLWT